MSSLAPNQVQPARLAELAARTLVHHPSALGCPASSYPWDSNWRLSRYVMLTEEVADLLLAEYRRLRPDNNFISLLYDGGRARATSARRVRLQTVDVRGLSVDASQLIRLMADNPRVLRFDALIEFSVSNLNAFNQHCGELRQLMVGTRTTPTTMFLDTALSAEDQEKRLAPDAEPLLDCPHLESFILVGSPAVGFKPSAHYIDALLRNMTCLTHLEICNLYTEVDVAFLSRMPHLVALILHNVYILFLARLTGLPRLKYLDISVPLASTGRRPTLMDDPDAVLDRLVRGLPALEHLDISGTPLAGSAVHRKPTDEEPSCDIIGLSSRVGRPLRYLGLYGCNASHRQHIPAAQIGGDIGEVQLLNTAYAHRHHVYMMIEILDQLEMLLQMNNGIQSWREILHLALDAMQEFYYFKDIHIRCGALIQNITTSRGWVRSLSEVERQRILRQLFRSVALHRKSIRVRHFIAIILMNFDVPREMLFAFSDFLDTLGHMLTGVLSERDNFVERVLIFLLNKTCCDVDGSRKVMIGRRGLIKMLLKAIHTRCLEHNCDEVMRFLWSCLWNVTDETPENCELFLENRGMRLFTQCLNEFKTDSSELVRNMMGLVGNIAEVQKLRAQFLTKEYVETFLRLLNYASTDLEISYHAAGVLSNMLSDGEKAWTLAEPSRAEVGSRLERAIREWDVKAQRSINYRSLLPIIRLLRCDVPESQLWAAWALANLTHAAPSRYGPMLEAEGGLLLMEVIVSSGGDSPLLRLARLCVDNVSGHIGLGMEEQADDSDNYS